MTEKRLEMRWSWTIKAGSRRKGKCAFLFLFAFDIQISDFVAWRSPDDCVVVSNFWNFQLRSTSGSLCVFRSTTATVEHFFPEAWKTTPLLWLIDVHHGSESLFSCTCYQSATQAKQKQASVWVAIRPLGYINYSKGYPCRGICHRQKETLVFLYAFKKKMQAV